MKLLPYGERGTYLDLDTGDAPDRASRTHALASRLRAAFPHADVVTGAGAVAVFGAAPEEVRAALERATADAYTSPACERTHTIPVRYDGPDLDDVAVSLGVSREALIDLHSGRDYAVEVVGFLPGFAYMGPLDPRLVLPRRPAPRPRVPARSVAVAGAFTGIYPLDSPGGWNLLGTSLGPPPFDPSRAEPFLFAPGDRVRFVPQAASPNTWAPNESRDAASPSTVSSNAWAPNESPAAASSSTVSPNAWAPNESPPAPALLVGRNPGLATVQDAGRAGLLHAGMPPSGPLDPDLFAAANLAAGNPPGAAAIELLAGSLELLARGDVALSIDGAPAFVLRDGDSLRLEQAPHAVRYLALAGGIDCPRVVGARATFLTARLGGLSGRVLRKGDILRAAPPRPDDPALLPREGPTPSPPRSPRAAPSPLAASLSAPSPLATSLASPLQIDPGPHLDRFPPAALDVLLTSDWRLSPLLDRTGARLDGARVPRSGPDLAAPVPMCRGAVQITTDGTPILLGPDHPTTGGYPVLAVLRAASFGALAQKRPGEPVRFRLASP